MLTQPISGEEAVAARQVKNGAAWFHWIAGLTVLNVVTAFCGLRWAFLLSLLLPLVLADTSHREHDSGVYISTALITLFVVWIYFLLGRAAQKGARWAFVTGMIFYGIDTLFWIGAKEGRALGLILHVLALFSMGRGLGAAKRLEALRHRNAPQAAAPAWSPPEIDDEADEDNDEEAEDEDDEENEALDRTPAPTVNVQAQILEAQIQAQRREMQAQEAAAPPFTPRVLQQTPQTPVAFAEIDALDTRIAAPDTKIDVPSTQIDSLNDGIDDRIDSPEV